MLLFKLVTAIHSFVFRITGGRWLGQMKGMDFCVVKTKGAKSGRTRYIRPLQEGRYFGCLDGRSGFSSVMVLEYQSAPWAFRLLAGAEYQCSS